MIDPKVIDQAEKIRQAGPVNMLDRKGVQYHAHQEGFDDLVLWIEDNPRTYMDLLMEVGKQRGRE